jgi:organic hydroperoxide reductase OsmC/OhrA
MPSISDCQQTSTLHDGDGAPAHPAVLDTAVGRGPGIRITQDAAYRFTVDFGDLVAGLAVDEAPPAGEGAGPCPEQLLVAAVSNCLCASLVFALGKFRQDAQGVRADAHCQIVRNAAGRLRIGGIEVAIALGQPAENLPRLDRVLEQFERFCTVSQSVESGIPVSVSVADATGRRLR